MEILNNDIFMNFFVLRNKHTISSHQFVSNVLNDLIRPALITLSRQ